MRAFSQHTGRVAPLNRANIDTDQIIPKQFLKRIERTGYGQFLFYDWRRSPSGAPDSDFVLSQRRFQGASILAANRNFGCGSSREHAVWALSDYGFRVIIAPSFADIFTNNCSKNGVLAIALKEDQVNDIMSRAEDVQNYEVSVNLENMTVTDEQGLHTTFIMEQGRRHRYLHGLDDIAITLQSLDQIDNFEAHRRDWLSFEPR